MSCAVDAVNPVMGNVHVALPPPVHAVVAVFAPVAPRLSVPAKTCVVVGAVPPSAIPTHHVFSVAEDFNVTVNLVP